MLVERSPGTASEVVGDRSLVVDPDGRSVVTLSPTGSVVWAAIDGRRDLDAGARGRWTWNTVQGRAPGSVSRGGVAMGVGDGHGADRERIAALWVEMRRDRSCLRVAVSRSVRTDVVIDVVSSYR